MERTARRFLERRDRDHVDFLHDEDYGDADSDPVMTGSLRPARAGERDDLTSRATARSILIPAESGNESLENGGLSVESRISQVVPSTENPPL